MSLEEGGLTEYPFCRLYLLCVTVDFNKKKNENGPFPRIEHLLFCFLFGIK